MALTMTRISYRSNRFCPQRSRRRGNRRGSPRSGRSNQGSYGIHNRRDKRWPFYAERPERVAVTSTADTLPAISHTIAELENAEVATADEPATSRTLDPVADKALSLWLQWNEAYEKVTACMAQLGDENAHRLEDILDQLDQMRLRAAKLSAKLVG